MTGMRSIRTACLLAAVSVIFLSLSGPAIWAQTGDRSEVIASALQSHDFERALAMLRTALQASPGDARLWAMQGTAYAGNNQKQQALASFHRALQISPDYLPALHGAAQIEYEAGSGRAIPLLQRALRLQPDDATGHGMLAVLEYQKNDCAAAVRHFEKASAVLGSQPSAQRALGICLVRLKQFDRAIGVFQHALAFQAGDPREVQSLAALQVMAHKPEDALTTLQPLLWSNSPDAETLELASSAYEASGDTGRAVSTLRQAILLDPHNVNLYLDFASLSEEHQSFQVGMNVVNDGIALQPKAAPLYFARGVLYVQTGENEKAEADFGQAYQLDPSQSLTVAAQGLAAEQANDLDGALATVQNKLAQKPNDPLLLYVQADILAQKGLQPSTAEFQTAMRSALRAASLRPSLGAAHGVLAKLYLQSGQYRQAADECRKVLANDPKDQAAVYRLIQALRKAGDKDEIPGLLKQLALLRKQDAKEQSQRNRYKLVEGDTAQ
jgi:tetratricopeptide (TPR) repeat protein